MDETTKPLRGESVTVGDLRKALERYEDSETLSLWGDILEECTLYDSAMNEVWKTYDF